MEILLQSGFSSLEIVEIESCSRMKDLMWLAFTSNLMRLDIACCVTLKK